MPDETSEAIIRDLASSDRPRADLWIARLAPDCAVRLGSRRTVYGLDDAAPLLRNLLGNAVHLGRCGCDVRGFDDYWIAETDISFRGRAGMTADPLVVAIRLDGTRIGDLRFYLDLAPLSFLNL